MTLTAAPLLPVTLMVTGISLIVTLMLSGWVLEEAINENSELAFASALSAGLKSENLGFAQAFALLSLP